MDETKQVITHLCEEMGSDIISEEEINQAIIYTIENSDKSDLETAVILDEHRPMITEAGKRIAIGLDTWKRVGLRGTRLTTQPRIFLYDDNLGDVIFSYLDQRIGDMQVESNRRSGKDTTVYTKDGVCYFWHYKGDHELRISTQIEDILKYFGPKLLMPTDDLKLLYEYNDGNYVTGKDKLTSTISTGFLRWPLICQDWFSSRFEKFDYVEFF